MVSSRDELLQRFSDLLAEARSLHDASLLAAMRQQLEEPIPSVPAAAVGVLVAGEPWHGIVGECQPMLDLRRLIGKFAPADAPVLITGESGTGMCEIHVLSTHVLVTTLHLLMIAQARPRHPRSLCSTLRPCVARAPRWTASRN